jgi:hypothetical protein
MGSRSRRRRKAAQEAAAVANQRATTTDASSIDALRETCAAAAAAPVPSSFAAPAASAGAGGGRLAFFYNQPAAASASSAASPSSSASAASSSSDETAIRRWFKAVSQNDVMAVTVHLGRADGDGDGASAEVDVRNEHGSTALMVAATAGFVPIVELLLARGAAVEARNRRGRTAMFLAVQHQHRAVYDALLAAGAETTTLVDAVGYTLYDLRWADAREVQERQCAQRVEARVSHPLDEFLMSSAGEEVGMNVGGIADLLENGARIECRNARNMTPLMIAASLGRAGTVGFLLERGADVNAVTRSRRRSALFFAVMNGHERVGETLLAAGSVRSVNYVMP